ncbi:hypothetical protein PLICRDRAFT_30463 [Plicaturopsis crispa FD-325 SS-3]|nr:hypothetical protein PLICRDRAFT_30463 [Plicaturopsis crispa FD-325 SS-3]
MSYPQSDKPSVLLRRTRQAFGSENIRPVRSTDSRASSRTAPARPLAELSNGQRPPTNDANLASNIPDGTPVFSSAKLPADSLLFSQPNDFRGASALPYTGQWMLEEQTMVVDFSETEHYHRQLDEVTEINTVLRAQIVALRETADGETAALREELARAREVQNKLFDECAALHFEKAKIEDEARRTRISLCAAREELQMHSKYTLGLSRMPEHRRDSYWDGAAFAAKRAENFWTKEPLDIGLDDPEEDE